MSAALKRLVKIIFENMPGGAPHRRTIINKLFVTAPFTCQISVLVESEMMYFFN